MRIDQHIEELTDSYLREELSGEQRASFEEMMSQDQQLSEYVSFQRDMIKGISEFRKLQIKARLDAIEVGAGWWGIGSGTWKVASSVVVATAIGIGAYVYWPDENKLEEVSSKLELSDKDIVMPAEEEIPAMPVVENAEEIAPAERTVIENTKTVAEVVEEVTPEPIEEVDTNVTEEFVPEVNKPMLSEVSEESQEKNALDKPETLATDWDENADQPIDVETIERRSKEIKYKYFDGKLYLYGDFKNEPYEILEINSSEAKKVYLFYMAKYYQIELTDDIKVLEAINDEGLIHELRIIRHNKVD